MQNSLKYIIAGISIAWISSAITYWLSDTPENMIMKRNKETIKRCTQEISYDSWTEDIQKAIIECWKLKLTRIIEPVETLNATGGIAPVPSWYTSKHSLVLSGSHSYTKYSDRKWASWKNNNSAWLTWGVSDELKDLWKKAGIRYRKGSPRPINEKGSYIYFETVEEGLRAKIIAIRERWGNATVSHYLAGWGTDDVKLSFDKSKIIKDLSDAEFTELFVQQMKKESPGYTSQLVADGILVIQ